MPVAATRKRPTNAAELLTLIEQLGGIDPERVRLKPVPGTATEADLLRVVDRLKRPCELVDRTLVEKPMGFEEDVLTPRLILALLQFIQPRKLGVVVGSKAPMRMVEGNIRLPDVGFVSAEQYRSWRRRKTSIADFAPVLAVEVLSRSNTREEMLRKRREYFASGTQMVWEIDPRKRIVTVFTTDRHGNRLTERETLDGGDLLPGFKLKLSELFADPLG